MLFAHEVFDILPQWVMKLGLIVCRWLFNLKLDYVIDIYIYIYIYVCMYVFMYMYIKFVKSKILFKLFCSRGEYVILWWFGCYELDLKQMGYEVLTMKVYVSCSVSSFSWHFFFLAMGYSAINLPYKTFAFSQHDSKVIFLDYLSLWFMSFGFLICCCGICLYEIKGFIPCF